jgi:serine/threonine protein kinase/tetratricopeptide (TPR) repeat protein
LTLAAGSRLGPYEILSPLGAGGMGEVYRARDTRLGRDVAVKVLPPEFSADAERLRRFEQESRAAGALNHPNILTIFDVGDHDHSPYVVSELLEGETLRQRLAGAALPQRKAVDYALQIARGLAAAHEMGIVHRDLKPENLFLTRDGRVKILDFGLAKLVSPKVGRAAETNAPTTPVFTEAGRILGTTGYMSPEQVRGQPADHRSDIFSFGSVLYEMLTGKRAFIRDTGVETMSAILKEEPPLLSSSPSVLPPGIDRVVRRCLEKNREERFQSASDLAFALEVALTDSAVSFPSRPPASASRRLRPGLLIAGLAAALALGALLLLLDVGGLRRWLRRPAGIAEIRSLAVLPLLNLSGDPHQEYFADGMTEALIADLAKIRALSVISRTSVMRYKGVRRPLPDIARELGVDAVLEGSVLRSGNRVRITAQLIHASTDRHLWAETYERELSDVLNLQREVARTVAEQIQIRVTPFEKTTLASPRRVDPAAYEAYLRGLYAWNKRSPGSVAQSIELFREAIGQDPAYAPAYAALADSYIVQASYGWVAPGEVAPLAQAAARKALELDPALAEAYVSLAGLSHLYDRDFPASERLFRRAIDAKPSYATAHHWYGNLLASLGRFDEAMTEMKRARELDPLSLIINTNLGRVFYFQHRYDAAIEQYERTLRIEPGFGGALWKLWHAQERAGRTEKAFAALESWAKSTGAEGLGEALRRAYQERGYPGALRGLLDRFPASGRVDPYNLALIYAKLGEKSAVFKWLDQACRERSSEIVYLDVEPVLDVVRSDPRFAAIRECVGLPVKARS